MGEVKNLEGLSKNIATKLLDTMTLTEILSDITDGDRKLCTLTQSIQNNIKQAFDDIETIRRFISIPN